jgi:hypothetical protein
MVFFKSLNIAIIISLVLSIAICRDAKSSLIIPRLNLTHEQLENYKAHDSRITKIINIVFSDIPHAQKLSWRMLLLGTVAAETNFLDRYAGRSKNGNGPYQIIGDTAYGIIHRYITYPLSGTRIIAKRKPLMPLFEKATDGRISWEQLYAMSKDELVELCVNDHDFAALMSLLVYKDAFDRNNIDEISSNPSELASLWKKYYNTDLGLGTEKRFIERFMPLYYHIV